jgi:hypothetical protein
MNKTKKLAIAGIVALALTSLGGAAIARTAAHRQNAPAAESEATTGADTDNVQEGDQTSPDTGTENEADETGSESAGESDGPGGHEDPPGNVDHQNEGEE